MLGIPSLYGWAAGAVLLVATNGFSLYEGVQREADYRDAQQVQSQQEQLIQYTIKAQDFVVQSTKLETNLEALHVVSQIVTQQVDKIVLRPIYRNVCLDDDGLRAVADSFAGKTAANTSGPDGKLSVTVSPGGRDRSDHPANAGRSRPDVQ